ncbi:glycosyltransferase family 1 protein [Candidatus Bathyarchaeota archaeon]|nr:glycosyltransferase family 1 protein [Candidatus Bathyarchaeota archaeon]
MRVLQVYDSLSPNTSEGRRVITVSNELTRLGHQVSVLTAFSDEGAFTGVLSEGVEVVTHRPLFHVRKFGFSPSIHGLIKRGEYDLIHAHSYRHYGTFAAALHSSRFKTPMVLSPYGTISHASSEGFTTMYRLQDALTMRLPLRQASRILANTLYEKSQIIEHGGDSSRIDVVYREVDTGLFRKAESAILEPGTIVYVGRVTPLKGLELLIDSLPYVGSEHRLAIVGPIEDQAYHEALLRRAQERGVSNKVEFVGGVEYGLIPLYLSSAEALVLPSLYENLGGVLLEAQACQCPVIASDVGGVGEVVVDGETGFLLKERSPHELGLKLGLLGDEELRHKMGANGRRFITSNFTKEHYLSKITDSYSKALDGRGD